MLLVVGNVVTAAAVACASATTGAPTWSELFSGAVGGPAPVPGLEQPIIETSQARRAVPVPARRACISVWNATVPAPTRRWIASRNARAADVTFMKSGFGVIGGSKRFTVSQCAFGVAVGSKEIVVAVAPLTPGSDPWRGELLHYRSAKTVSGLVIRFTAVVRTDGSIGTG